METIISSKHYNINDALKEEINKKAAELSTIYNKLTILRIVLDSKRNFCNAEIILHGKDIDFEATAETDDMYATINKAFERMTRQLRKFLDKKQDHHKAAHSEQ
ncbi:MAG: ribosome-associated translation inhibitor RaiA [Verrucomicrobiota bacterium]|nr:ribosome-associated translation inhibitor RaiA [Verrucomicrobiota bacterium]